MTKKKEFDNHKIRNDDMEESDDEKLSDDEDKSVHNNVITNVTGKDNDDRGINNDEEGSDDDDQSDAENGIDNDQVIYIKEKNKNSVPLIESPQEVHPARFKYGSILVSLSDGAKKIR